MPKFAFTPALTIIAVTKNGITLNAKSDVCITHVNHPLNAGFDLSAFSGFDCRQIAPGQFYLVGDVVLPELTNVTFTDQSHGTAMIELNGGNYLTVLASLTGADLNETGLQARSAIQTRLGHVAVNLKLCDNGASIIAPRSFSAAIYSDLAEAISIFG